VSWSGHQVSLGLDDSGGVSLLWSYPGSSGLDEAASGYFHQGAWQFDTVCRSTPLVEWFLNFMGLPADRYGRFARFNRQLWRSGGLHWPVGAG
jgi:hypothetical protein